MNTDTIALVGVLSGIWVSLTVISEWRKVPFLSFIVAFIGFGIALAVLEPGAPVPPTWQYIAGIAIIAVSLLQILMGVTLVRQ